MTAKPDRALVNKNQREMKEKGWSWGEVVKLAKDKQQWRSLVTALCAYTHEED